MSVQFSDLLPTHGAHRVAGFKTVDSFRVFLNRSPNPPKPIKIGHANFYRRDDLEALKRARADAAKIGNLRRDGIRF